MTTPCAESWFVLQIIPGQHTAVSQRLDRLGVDHYVAMRKHTSTHKRYGTLLERTFPAFPGYIFTALPSNWWAVRDLEGVIKYLEMYDKPEPISFGEVAKIRIACEMGDYDYLESVARGFEARDRVTLTVGPLAGKIGTVLSMRGNNAMRVMMDQMPRPVVVPVDMVALAG